VVAMSVLMPILYLLILGNSFQGKLKGLPLAVVRQDTGSQSRRLLENLRGIERGPETVRIFLLRDREAALAGVRDGVYKAALIIPPDFSRRFTLQNRPEIGLFLDNTDAISASLCRGRCAAPCTPSARNTSASVSQGGRPISGTSTSTGRWIIFSPWYREW